MGKVHQMLLTPTRTASETDYPKAAANYVWHCNNINNSRVGITMLGLHPVSKMVCQSLQTNSFSWVLNRDRLSKHPHELHGAFAQYHNEQISNGPLSHLQPFLAWLGFIGCFLIIFFSTASWWQWGKPSARDVLATWIVVSSLAVLLNHILRQTQPVLALLSWVIMKQFSTTRNGRWGMNNDLDWNALKIELCRLTDLINDEGAIADDEQGGLSQSRYQVDGSEVNGRELMDSPQDTESRPNVLREPSLQKPLQNLQNTAREEEIGTEE
jgi:hypothetical protein